MYTFSIEKELSDSKGCLVLQWRENEQPKQGGQQTLLANLGCKNKELGRILLEEETAYRRKNKPEEAGYSLFHISYSKCFAALKELGAAGWLRFKEKPIYLDLFGRTKVKLILEKNPILILQEAEREFPLTECEFLCGGPPHWYIYKSFLRFLETDLPFKVLSASSKGSWSPSRQELAQWADTTDNCLLEQVNLSPLPLLKLTDRMGAFADLWQQYGEEKIPMHDPRKECKGIRRKPEEEHAWEKDLIETGFIKKVMPDSHYYCPLHQVSKSLSFLLDLGWQIEDRGGNRLVRMGDIALQAETKPASYLIQGKAKFEETEVDLAKVAGAFVRRERFLQIGGGLTGLLPDRLPNSSLESLCDEAEIVTEGLKLKHNSIGTLQQLFKENKVEASLDLVKLREKLEHPHRLADGQLGPGFSGELRGYQAKGVEWLKNLYELGLHGLLADDMGLGKTVQVLAFLSTMPKDAGPHGIIVPASLVFNWRREIERFLPAARLIEHRGTHRSNDLQQLAQADILLTSYATLRQDLPLLNQIDYHTVILDEAQIIKNADTQVFQAVCQLSARFRLTMTGTPVENHLQELWSQFSFLIPGLLDGREDFILQLSSSESDKRYLQRIKSKIQPFILRRTKKEVAPELPEKIEQTVWVEFEEQQRQIYEDFLAGIRGNLLKKVELEGAAQHRMEILEAILRLRQICCHPALVSSLLTEEEAAIPSSKMETFLNEVKLLVEEGAKVLIYSQFTSMLTLLTKAIKEQGWKYTLLDGATKNREQVVIEFQENPEVQLFLISLKAGAFGLNLTAADYVLIYEPWWNEAVENQAIDRAHRIGRKDPVFAKRYAIRGSIEERIMQLKEKKKEIAAELFDSNHATGDLSLENLRFLLS